MGAVSRVLIALLALRFLIWAFRLRGNTRIVPAQAAKLGVRLSSRLSFFPPGSPIVMPDLLHTSLSRIPAFLDIISTTPFVPSLAVILFAAFKVLVSGCDFEGGFGDWACGVFTRQASSSLQVHCCILS